MMWCGMKKAQTIRTQFRYNFEIAQNKWSSLEVKKKNSNKNTESNNFSLIKNICVLRWREFAILSIHIF